MKRSLQKKKYKHIAAGWGGVHMWDPNEETQTKIVTILQKQASVSQWHWELEDQRRDEGGRLSYGWTGPSLSAAPGNKWVCFTRPQFLEPSPFLALIWTVPGA